jgi:hypothetical protein
MGDADVISMLYGIPAVRLTVPLTAQVTDVPLMVASTDDIGMGDETLRAT